MIDIGALTPPLYSRMKQDDALGLAISRDDWKQRAREILKTKPPALSLCDVEWRPELSVCEKPDYWLPDYDYVDFAQNGAGDLYAWSPQFMNGAAAAVLYVPHDLNQGEIVAPHFEGFLFRKTLQACASLYDEDGAISVDDMLAQLHAGINVLRPYLRADYLAVLDEVTARQLNKKGDHDYSFLSFKEAKTLAAKALDFAKLDSTFKR
jgi:hypothetical protein